MSLTLPLIVIGDARIKWSSSGGRSRCPSPPPSLQAQSQRFLRVEPDDFRRHRYHLPAKSRQARGAAFAPQSRPCTPAGQHLLFFRSRNKPFPLGLLACGLAGSTDSFGLFPSRFFGRLLVKSTTLHLAKHAFPLHLFLEHPERLIDVVVANKDLQETFPSCVDRWRLKNSRTAAVYVSLTNFFGPAH
jgi:hypothetical protein